jgi:hypothetical protein
MTEQMMNVRTLVENTPAPISAGDDPRIKSEDFAAERLMELEVGFFVTITRRGS